MRLVIINDASLARGGATGLALLQARLMRARGFDVTFFAADGLDNPALRDAGVDLHHVGLDPLMKARPAAAFTRGLYSRQVAQRLSQLISKSDTPETVYHVHSWSKALSPSVFSALQPVSHRVFVHAHDFFLGCPNGAFMNYRTMEPCALTALGAGCVKTQCDKRNGAQKAWRLARHAVLSQTLPKAQSLAGIILIHPGMAEGLERAGYDPSQFAVVRNPASALSHKRVPVENNQGFVFLGRIEAEKGVEDAVAAVARAEVPLTVIGDGPLRLSLAEQHPAVRFTGWLPRAEIEAEIQTARGFVMPSRYPEPFGLVAAEASLSGLPVILSHTALLAGEIAAAGIGFACDTQDIETFAARLRSLAEMDRAEAKAMSVKAASGSAGLCVTPAEWIDGQLALYDQAIAVAERQSA